MNALHRVILVEDDPFDAELTIRELRMIPLANEIKHFDEAQLALDWLLEERGQNIGVVLMDLKMPGMNGLELIRSMKQTSFLQTIPIVVLTSSRENPDVQYCYELGVNSYVTKPVVRAEFKDAIRSLGLFWAIVNQPPRPAG